MMTAAEHPEQGLRRGQGILSLARRYPHERLEAAAKRALHYGLLSYKGVRNILESGLDSVAIEEEPSPSPAPVHDNVRGAEYYEARSCRMVTNATSEILSPKAVALPGEEIHCLDRVLQIQPMVDRQMPIEIGMVMTTSDRQPGLRRCTAPAALVRQLGHCVSVDACSCFVASGLARVDPTIRAVVAVDMWTALRPDHRPTARLRTAAYQAADLHANW